VAGLPYTAEHFHPREYWSNNSPSLNRAHHRLLNIVSAGNLIQPSLSELRRTRSFGEARVTVLAPHPDHAEGKTADQLMERLNDDSLVIRIEMGAFSFLLPGDLETLGEQSLVREHGLNLKSDVLVASHHGSAYSMTPGFLAAVAPSRVVFSVGPFRDGIFPADEVVSRVRAAGADIYRTDVSGAIRFTTDGRNMDVSTTRSNQRSCKNE
jgi:beta-lactamase superfamily II metal-dependent hydrolase